MGPAGPLLLADPLAQAAPTGGSAATGGTGGMRPCTSSGTVAFVHSDPGTPADCIVPGVCLNASRL